MKAKRVHLTILIQCCVQSNPFCWNQKKKLYFSIRSGKIYVNLILMGLKPINTNNNLFLDSNI